MSSAAAELRGASRRYGAVLALDATTVAVAPGEVRALLGKNGAGKSTLIRLLTGAELPDTGEVLIGGALVTAPRRLRAAAIGARGLRAVYQELSLVPALSIAENIFGGHWPRKRLGLDRATMHARARRALDHVGLELDPSRAIASLSPAQRQLVEIARAFADAPAIVILDEPTSSLGGAEVGRVLDAVREAARAGTAVIYVSHRMEEIRQVADTATVMRDGRVVATAPVTAMSTADVVSLMLGAAATATAAAPALAAGSVAAAPLLVVRDLASPPRLRGVSFALRAGEVVGIAGLLGSGRTELLECILGLRPIEAGTIELDGATVGRPRLRAMFARGIGYAPEDRKERGIVPMLGIDENAVMTDLRPVSQCGVLSRRRLRAHVEELVRRLDIRTADTRTPIASLSGGNQQKVVIGRWIHARARLLLLDEPTRGVDVAAKAQIYSLIRGLARDGCAVVFVSSEIEELGAVCDRALVLRGGTIAAEHRAPDLAPERLLAACMAEAV